MKNLRVQISLPEVLEDKLVEKQKQNMPGGTLKDYILDALRRDVGLPTLKESPAKKAARVRNNRDRNIRFLYDNGTGAKEIAEIFDISVRTVYHIVK